MVASKGRNDISLCAEASGASQIEPKSPKLQHPKNSVLRRRNSLGLCTILHPTSLARIVASIF
jgi:hypothetical protein